MTGFLLLNQEFVAYLLNDTKLNSGSFALFKRRGGSKSVSVYASPSYVICYNAPLLIFRGRFRPVPPYTLREVRHD